MVRATLFYCNVTCVSIFINMLKMSVNLNKKKSRTSKIILLSFYTTIIFNANNNYFILSQTTF